jgi:XRE family aerobic/anaerobic benzoate catabolism transcriptional regulator
LRTLTRERGPTSTILLDGHGDVQYIASMPASPADSTILARLGRTLRGRRESAGLTIREVALRAGLSQRFVAMVESGLGNISLTRLESLAAALEASPAEVLRESDRAPKARQVALLGLRGAGKSTLGPLAARATGRRFVELDRVIEETAGMPLAEIFAVHGEPYYRKIEREALEGLLRSSEPLVIATGGGIVAVRETWELLRRSCHLVWLRAAPRDHWERVTGQGDERPMASRPNAMAELRAILRERDPLYREADSTIDTSRLSVAGGAAALVRVIRRLAPEGPRVTGRATRPSSRSGRRRPEA